MKMFSLTTLLFGAGWLFLLVISSDKVPSPIKSGLSSYKKTTKMRADSLRNFQLIIKQLEDLWSRTSLLNNGTLIEILESNEENQLTDKTGIIIWMFWNQSKSIDNKEVTMFDSFEYYESEIPKFVDLFEEQLKFRHFDFILVCKAIKFFSKLTESKKLLFLDAASATKYVKIFFKRFKDISRGDHWMLRLAEVLIPQVLQSTEEYFYMLVESLKTWKQFDHKTKEVTRRVISNKVRHFECVDIWKSQNSSRQMKKMVEMVEAMDASMGTGSCFSKIKSRIGTELNAQPLPHEFQYLDFKDLDSTIELLSQYFHRTTLLNNEVLIEILEAAENINLVDETGKLVLELWDFQNKTNALGTEVFDIFDRYLTQIPEIDWFFSVEILEFRDFDFKFVTKIVEQFGKMPTYQKKLFMEKLHVSHNYRAVPQSMVRFFKRLDKLENPSWWLQRLGGELIRHTRWSPAILFNDVGNSLRLWNTMKSDNKELAKKLMSSLINPVKCLDVWQKKDSSEDMRQLFIILDQLDSHLGTSSCLSKIKHKIIESPRSHSDASLFDISSSEHHWLDSLNEMWERKPLLKNGDLITVLELSEKNNLVDKTGEAVIDFWKLSDGSSNEQLSDVFEKYLRSIPNFDWYFRLQVVDFRYFNFYELLPVLKRFDDMSVTEKDDFFIKLRVSFNHLPSAKPIFDFFKRFSALKKGNYWFERLGFTLVHETNKSSIDFFNSIADGLDSYNNHCATKSMIIFLEWEEISDNDCVDSFTMDSNYSRNASKIISSLETHGLFKKSCLSRKHVKSLASMHKFLRDGRILAEYEHYEKGEIHRLEQMGEFLKSEYLLILKSEFLSKKVESSRETLLLRSSFELAKKVMGDQGSLRKIEELAAMKGWSRAMFTSSLSDNLKFSMKKLIHGTKLFSFLETIRHQFIPKIEKIHLGRMQLIFNISAQ